MDKEGEGGVEEKDVGEDEDMETSIHHALGDQREDCTVGREVHPAATAVADTEEKSEDIRTTQLQRIILEASYTRLHDIIAIVK